MKSEREIAKLIFDKFRVTKCKTNGIVPINSIRSGVIDKLNPKESEIFDKVFVGLRALGYFIYEQDGLPCIRLTEKGYDYIYDDEQIERMSKKPWLIPFSKNTDWDKAYNVLWNVIGPQESAVHYIKGPRFYEFILELCDNIPPSYSDYIEQRRKKELSISRRYYYKDLIDNLDIDKRFALYVKIQSYIENDDKQETIKNAEFNLSSLDIQEPVQTTSSVEVVHTDKTLVEEVKENEVPTVFISYSWDSPEHEAWVVKLAEKLVGNGVNIILDKWDLGRLGSLLPNFMEQSISKSKRVICVMTPNYKKKTDRLEGGVGYEYSIITAEIFREINTSKFIPLIREGSDADAIPTALRERKYINMREDKEFDTKLEDLLRDIYNVPKYKKPTIGPRPKFD